jgi:HEXXH motif-containing protein
LVETLIHEFSHNLLNALIDQHGILAEDCPRGELFYSPWRPDARPLSGILHAVYVFERIAEFYERYLSLYPDADAYRQRYASIVGRLVLGLRTLQQAARFNDEGTAFFARLSAGVEKHRLSGITLLDTAGRAELEEHLSSWRMRHFDLLPTEFTL